MCIDKEPRNKSVSAARLSPAPRTCSSQDAGPYLLASAADREEVESLGVHPTHHCLPLACWPVVASP